jgi:4-diphosphocytidyl-2-C-methyl-D-erythritol kinase
MPQPSIAYPRLLKAKIQEAPATHPMNLATVASPAKLNLFLAVTGRRPDGYHDLVSVVAPLAWGDTVEARLSGGDFTLACDDPAVPLDETNLVLRAARAFRAASGIAGGVAFTLGKRIPTGAGLGGGSSNAVAALRALNLLFGGPLDAGRLGSLAAQLGSDCPLFLEDGPSVVRGRGERIARMEPGPAGRLSGRRVLVFKPGFGIGTAWAYARLDGLEERTRATPPGDAERLLGAWLADPLAPAERLLFNGFERVAFPKFPALPLLLGRLQREFRLQAGLSGSGSACFALLDEGGRCDAGRVSALIRETWGSSAVVVETRIA